MKPALLAALCAAAVGVVFWGAQPPVMQPLPLSLCVLGVLASEIKATRLPGAGFASCSYAFLLAAALALGPPVAVGMSAIVLLVGLARARLLEVFGSLSCVLVGLAATHLASGTLWKPVAGSLLYLAMAEWTPDLLVSELPKEQRQRHNLVQSRLTGVRLGMCAAAVVLAHLPGWLSLAVLPLWWGLVRQTEAVVLLEEQAQRRDLVRELNTSHQRLEKASETHNQLRSELLRSEDEYRILDASARTFAQVRSTQQTADELVKLAGALVQAQTVAVFVREGEILVPRSLRSPHAERLHSAGLTGLNEPILHQALHLQDVLTQPLGSPETRVFRDENQVLVFPLGNLGVLYLGRPGPPFQVNDLRYLSQASYQGGLGLQIATHLEELQRAFQQQARISEELAQWTQALDRLLVYSVEFLSQLSRELLPEKVGRAVQGLMSGDSLEVRLDGQHPLAACQEVLKNRTPLLVDDLAETRFEGHRAGQRSLLCVPIYHSELPMVGLIVVGAKEPNSFTRLHRDSLMLVAFLAAVAWKNAELHAATVAAQNQMFQSSKMAAVGQLAAGVAHELNTPFAAIQINMDMASSMIETDAAKNADKVCQRLAKGLQVLERARSIVDKLLVYSRLSEDVRMATDLNQVMADTLELAAPSLGEVEVQWQPGTIGPVLADPVEIQQAVMNVLLNARDAALRPGSSSKAVQVHTLREGDQICLSIRDFGPGIEPDVQPRVFDPFFTTKQVGEGVGLGLSIAQQIATTHQGTLTFRTQPGKGTQFQLRLPAMPG